MSKEEKCCGAGNNGRHGIGGGGGCLYSLKSLGWNVSEVGRDGRRMMVEVAGTEFESHVWVTTEEDGVKEERENWIVVGEH